MNVVTGLTSTTTIVLCGGLGTRLATKLQGTPKFLAQLGDRPYAHHLLEWLAAWHLHDVILCVGHLADKITSFCGDGARWGLSLRYSHEQAPLGTAGAVRLAVRQPVAQTLLVLNGDTLLGFDPHDALRLHAQGMRPVTLLVTDVPDRSRFGALEIDSSGRVTRFVEKGRTGRGLVSAGVYVINTDFVRGLPARRPLSLECDVLAPMPPDALHALVVPGPFLDFGVPNAIDDAVDATTFLLRPEDR